MNFLKLAENRYTTKTYTKNKKITINEIEDLKEILRLSPSSINSQPWKFTFISNKEVKEQLAAHSYFNANKIKDASHIVVFSVLDSIPLFEKQISENLPEGAIGYYKQFIKPKKDFEIKAWFSNQVYLSLGFFLSACASMHIDSTPMEGIVTDDYDAVLDVKNYKTLFAVAIGYRDSEDSNQPSVKAKVRLNKEIIINSL